MCAHAHTHRVTWARISPRPATPVAVRSGKDIRDRNSVLYRHWGEVEMLEVMVATEIRSQDSQISQVGKKGLQRSSLSAPTYDSYLVMEEVQTRKWCVLPIFTGSGAQATSLGSRDPGWDSMSFPTLSHSFWPDLAPLSSPIREMDRKLKITRQFERIKDKGD